MQGAHGTHFVRRVKYQSNTNERSNHPLLIPMIASVQRQGEAYYRGLDISIKTAENAYTFATDAQDLCKALLNPDYSIQELQGFIDDMRELAQDAREDAKNTSNVFRAVRSALNQVGLCYYENNLPMNNVRKIKYPKITSDIPADVLQVEEQQRSAEELTAYAGGRRDMARTIKVAAGFASSIVASLGPPGIAAAIIPAVFYFANSADETYTQQAEGNIAFRNVHIRKMVLTFVHQEGEIEVKDCAEAMKQLHRAAEDLAVSSFHSLHCEAANSITDVRFLESMLIYLRIGGWKWIQCLKP